MTSHLQREEAEMRPFRLAIVILAHHRAEQLAALVRALRHPQATVYLHVDSGAPIEPFRDALAAAGADDVVWLTRHRSQWATLAVVDAELEGIRRALADGCSYVMLISGEDFPLRAIAAIVEFARENRERTYILGTKLPLESGRYQGRERTDFYSFNLPYPSGVHTVIPRGEDVSHFRLRRRAFNLGLRALTLGRPPRRFPPYLEAHAGHQWINLSRAAGLFVVDFLQRRPDYHRYHRYTACPDEIHIQSILLGSDFARDHEIVPDDLRFLIWPAGAWPVAAHPKVLAREDLPAMLESGKLFARKIVAEHDPELFAALVARSQEPLPPPISTLS